MSKERAEFSAMDIGQRPLVFVCDGKELIYYGITWSNPRLFGGNKLFSWRACEFRLIFFQAACHRLVEERLAYDFSSIDSFLFL